jgi:hypothetical protein
MAHYRAYAVRFDGNFDGYEPLNCDDDDEAIGRAIRLSNNSAIELGLVSASLPGWNTSRSDAPAAWSKLHELGPRQLVNSVILPLPAQASHFIG